MSKKKKKTNLKITQLADLSKWEITSIENVVWSRVQVNTRIFSILNVYLPNPQSPFYIHYHDMLVYIESSIAERQHAGDIIIVMGDLNNRVSCLPSIMRNGNKYFRDSDSTVTSSTAPYLLSLFDAHDLLILTGVLMPASPTFNGPQGKSEIDHIVIPDHLLHNVTLLEVDPDPTMVYSSDHYAVKCVLSFYYNKFAKKIFFL